MCLPFLAPIGALLGAGASTAAAVGTSAVLSAASAGLSAVGAYQQAQAQKASATYNAAVADNNAATARIAANDAEARGDMEQRRIGRQQGDIRAQQTANLAASGLDLTSGSPLAVLEQTDYYGMQDQSTVAANTGKEAWSLRTKGSNYSTEAAGQRATAGSISPWTAGAGSLLSSAGQVADRWYRYSKAA